MKSILLAVLVGVFIAGCIPDSPNLDDLGSNEAYSPKSNNVSAIKLVDAGSRSVSNAEVSITKIHNSEPLKVLSAKSLSMMTALKTDENGYLKTDELTPGKYQLSVSLLGVEAVIYFEINPDNTLKESTLMVPISVYEDKEGELTAVNLVNAGIFAALNGLVYDKSGPVSGVQVEISGGADTNGAITTAITDVNGEFFIVVNVALDKFDAMQNATIRIYKPGYTAKILTEQDFTNGSSVVGMNILLLVEEVAETVVYSETFDVSIDDAVCGAWQAMAIDRKDFGEFVFPEESTPPTGITEVPTKQDSLETAESSEDSEPAESSDREPLENFWHQHTPGLHIQNQAYLANLVQLAPDDMSNAYVPDPVGISACWYGVAKPGSLSQGNFIGQPFGDEEVNLGGDELDGGDSVTANGGAIVSPVIDLTNENYPLSLTFKTWWEIEAVNPNENGFDLMIVEYSQDEGETWHPLARLNPLADPAEGSDINREPLPYSNRGYNQSPAWLWQEPIPLDQFAGSKVQFRFVFSTNDEYYNGFRGWLVDNVVIERKAGTFPLYVLPVFVIKGVRTSQILPNTDMSIRVIVDVNPKYMKSAARLELVHINEDSVTKILDSKSLAGSDSRMSLRGSVVTLSEGEILFSIRLFDEAGKLMRSEERKYYVPGEEPQ